jgi:hypothetical protein
LESSHDSNRFRQVDIPAPQRSWSVMAEVERWPEWTSSVSRVKRLCPEPLRVGSRVDSTAGAAGVLAVTELRPGAGFTWVNALPNARDGPTSAEAIAGDSRALSICYEGLLGVLARGSAI